MTAQEIQHTLNNGDLDALEALRAEIPWFAPVHVSLAEKLQEDRDRSHPESLSKAAIYVGSPAVLYDLIVAPEVFAQSEAKEVAISGESDKSDEQLVVPETLKESEQEEEPVEESAEAHEAVSADDFDPLNKEIIVGAVSRTIEQEVQPESEEEITAEPEVPKDASKELDLSQENLSPFAAYLLRRSREVGFQEEEESKMESGTAAQADTMDAASLIDRFIAKEPKITPRKAEEYTTGDLAKKSLVEDENLVTETMAQIYAAQGKMEKARRAYRLLSLKYPEKSVYFAAQLKKLGKKTN
ncbi:MAG: hypothetical protein HKN33_07815 [Pyrinomonadaceae bacterium]|nr:hypothetical protein [Flavobacteriales bacterium]NNE66458.1 hypothetical protein [Pyrinomonadaceae bacterium]